MTGRDEWKRLILSLPDSEFFEIIRNYIGEVKTPFNKHELIDRLARLLGRDDVRERILELIGPEDADLLSAVWFLESPTLEELTTFFDRPYLELHYHLVNLEQRLLILSDRTEKPVRLRLNPLLEEPLLSGAVHPDFIFPPEGRADSPSPEPWFSELLIISVLTYFAGDRNLLKNDGGIKKRFLDELKTLFPVLFEEEPCGLRLRLLFEVLANAGLLKQNDSSFIAFPPAVRELEGLDREQRMLRLAAKAIPPKLAGRFEGERILKTLLRLLEPESFYSMKTVEKGVRGICLRNGWPLTNPEEIARRICSSGAIAAVYSPAGENAVTGNTPLYRKTAPPAVAADPDTGKAKIVLQPTFSITVKPEITLFEGTLLIRSAEVRRYDRYSQFEITKESFSRGLQSGLTSVEIADKLGELSGSPVPQNLVFTFSTWEKEYRSISLYRGIVLAADEERRHLIEHDPRIQRYIKRTLAPGVYLLSEAEREGWEEAFFDAGITPLPAVLDSTPAKPRLPSLNTLFPGEDRDESTLPRIPITPPPAVTKSDSQLEELIHRVESMEITDEEREELEARIRKKLILFEEQLTPGLARGAEKAEAKGLDFIGKVRLIEQTIQSGSDLLEVIVRGSRGDPKRYLMKPRTIDRTGSELKLVGKILPGEKEMSLQIRKLSLVRRLKSSLFSP